MKPSKTTFLGFCYYPLNISRDEEVIRRMRIVISVIFDNHYTNELGKNGLLNLKSLHKIKNVLACFIKQLIVFVGEIESINSMIKELKSYVKMLICFLL